MKAKYPRPPQHTHVVSLMARAFNAEFEQYMKHSRTWSRVAHPAFFPDQEYRIDPKCSYALAHIEKEGGEVGVRYYLKWLEGVELEFLEQNWLPLPPPSKDPFMKFFSLLTDTVGIAFRHRRNKDKVVLWIKLVEGECVETRWVKEGQEMVSPWHEVPSKTKEVYEDEAV